MEIVRQPLIILNGFAYFTENNQFIRSITPRSKSFFVI